MKTICEICGSEKAPAAICRKVAEAEDGGTIEVWGDGTAVRVFTYVDDLVDGIYTLMQSDLEGPVNLGSDERVTVGTTDYTDYTDFCGFRALSVQSVKSVVRGVGQADQGEVRPGAGGGARA